MTKMEQKILQWIDARLLILFFIIINLLGIAIRMSGEAFVSKDASVFLLPWFEQIKGSGGFRALGNQVGDYNIPYQFLIAALTYLPFNSLTLYKGLSVFFDYTLALGAALLACEVLKKKITNCSSVFVIVYASVLFLPTVVINSSVWAQCDSIYTTFVIFSLLFLMKKKYKVAFAVLGLAFSFKLQTIFILPFYLYYYFLVKKISFLNFTITVLFFYIPSIPGFLCGRSIFDPISIYFLQSENYPQMWLNFPSFWVFVGDNYEVLSKMAILLTIFILGCGLFYVLFEKVDLLEQQNCLKTAIWSIWTCLIFLPAMHDRYGYMLEILLLIMAFINAKYIFGIVVTEITSILTYGYFLFQNSINIQMLSCFYFVAYLGYSIMVVIDRKAAKNSRFDMCKG